MHSHTIMACPECDLLHRVPPPPRGGLSLCIRCGATLERGRQGGFEVALALYVGALFLFLLAGSFPLLKLTLHGAAQEASLPRCAQALASLEWPWLSAVLITTVILAPLVHLVGMILVLCHLRMGIRKSWTPMVFRLVEEFRGWGMAEVFVLGLLISYVKLSQWATVMPGPSLYALGAFMLVAVAAVTVVDSRAVWERIQPAAVPPVPEGARTAREASLVACTACGHLSPMGGPARCPRCRASLHSRKPASRQRTWALLVTSAILYLPANLLPVMRMVSIGRTEADTIMGGIVRFAQSGSWGLALLIFVASFMVPLLKMVALTALMLSERRASGWPPEQRTRLYRFMEAVGRWSMVDVFVVTLMVALVELGSLATIEPQPGSVAFALVVAAGMLAVRCFDPRLVWDALEPANG